MSCQPMKRTKNKCILLSKRCQSETNAVSILTVWHSGKGKTMKTGKQSIVSMGSEGRKNKQKQKDVSKSENIVKSFRM